MFDIIGTLILLGLPAAFVTTRRFERLDVHLPVVPTAAHSQARQVHQLAASAAGDGHGEYRERVLHDADAVPLRVHVRGAGPAR